MHRNIRGFHNEFSVPRFWSTGTAVDKSKHQHVCRHVPWPHTHAHAPAPRSPASRAPADTPAAPRSPRSQHLRLGGASPTRLSIRQRLTPYLRRPSPLPLRRCMLRSISRKKSLSFNHRHLNCFIYVLSYVAKLEDPQRGA